MEVFSVASKFPENQKMNEIVCSATTAQHCTAQHRNGVRVCAPKSYYLKRQLQTSIKKLEIYEIDRKWSYSSLELFFSIIQSNFSGFLKANKIQCTLTQLIVIVSQQ